jgi:glycosyltransferase involved in cell wall biosynthesis
MHIVFVQPVIPLYSISFFNRLVENNEIEVTVLANIKCDNQLNQYDKSICNFNVFHLDERKVGGFLLRPKLNKLLSNIDYTHLILSGAPRDISQLVQLLLSSLKGENIYTWGMFHRIGGKRFISEVYYKVAGYFSKKCFCYSKTGLCAQLNRGVHFNKLVELGTAIDELSIIEEKNSRSSSDILDFKIKNDLVHKDIVLQVVRLSSIKKPHLIIEAAKIIATKKPNVLFVLIGGGELEVYLKKLTEKYSLKNNILFLGPVYDEEILSYWFLSADVFVVPSCIGLSAHHAMCYGLPIITDNDYLKQASEFDILSNGLNCSLYEANSAGSLADEIISLLNNPEKRDFIAANASYTVSKLYNLDNKVDKLLNGLFN